MIQLLQRTSRKRLGYNGISEILTHPWLSVKYEQRVIFLEKRLPSPITPLQISFSQSLQEITEPDDVWRENILLLKRPDIQRTSFLMQACSSTTTTVRRGNGPRVGRASTPPRTP